MFFGRKKRTVRETSERQPSKPVKSRPKKVGGRGCNPYESTGPGTKRPSGVTKVRPKNGAGGGSSNPYDTASKYPDRRDPWAGVRTGDFHRR
jgi:hypothetical protein